MTPGAMCPIAPEEDAMCYPGIRVVWCEATEPAPDCSDDEDDAQM